MKKKILFISLFLVVAITVTFLFNKERSNLENLMLENIDALASGESDIFIRCVGSGSVDCPRNHVKVYLVREGYSLEDFN